jgi:hypothetical protein
MTRRFPYAPLLLLATALPAHAAVRAWLDNTQIGPGDTVQLTLAHDGHTNTRPDLAPLKQDFDVLSNSSSSSLQIVNGRASSITEIELSLAPKHSGQLTVPALTWDSDRSAALTLNVTASGAAGSGTGTARSTTAGRVFLQTEVDPKSPYVQAGVHVTVRVYAAVPLSHADLEFSDTDAALVRQVGSDGVSTSEKNGQSYQLVTRHYLVFPQQSGHLEIPGPTLSGNIPDSTRRPDPADPFSGFFAGSPFSGMFATSKPVRVHGEPVVLDVRPRPAGAGMNYWLPARNVTLHADWQPPQLQAHVGDPVTVDLELRAEGLTAAQLPDMSALLALPAGLKVYPDQPKLKDLPHGEDIVGERAQSIALIPDQPGQFTIPELRVNWWDTEANQIRETILPARTLVVQAMPGSSVPAPTPPAQTAPVAPTPAPPSVAAGRSQDGSALAGSRDLLAWRWISLGFGLLWLATLLAWLRTHKRNTRTEVTTLDGAPVPDTDVSNPRASFRAACRANDARAARRNLLLWANAAWTGPRILGLNALAKLIDDPAIATLLGALDRACYAGDTWTGEALVNSLPDLPFRNRTTVRRTRQLAPLYR